MNRWIKSSEQLPPKDRVFIAFDGNRYYVLEWGNNCYGEGPGYWNGIDEWTCQILVRENDFSNEFSHWMIPEPPE